MCMLTWAYKKISFGKVAIMKYGIQMYSLRDITGSDMKGALRAVAEMGYKTVEFAGFFGIDAKDIKAMLDEYGLTCVSTHTGLDEIKNNYADTLRYMEAIGNRDIIIPFTNPANQSEIDEIISSINELEPKLRNDGFKLAYHNHSHEFIPNADGSMIHQQLEDKTNVLFEIDTYWAFNAKIDPIAILERLKDRITHIHLKDGIASAADCKNFDHVHDGVKGLSVGSGKNNIPAIVDWANKNNVLMVIESEGLDPTGLEEVGRCIEYLRTLD